MNTSALRSVIGARQLLLRARESRAVVARNALQKPAARTFYRPSDNLTSKDMLYPYTFAAKLRQFPWRWTIRNNFIIKLYLVSFGLCFLYVFYPIHKAVHSPGNVWEWDEVRKRREHSHFDAHTDRQQKLKAVDDY